MSSLEERIEKLQKDLQEYNSLSNKKKIANALKYNKVCKDKDSIEKELDDINKKIEEIDQLPEKDKCTKKMYISLSKFVNELEDSIDDSMSLDDLIELYEKLTDAKRKMCGYLEKRKMTIKKIDIK